MEKEKINNEIYSQSLTILDIILIFLKNKRNIFILTGIFCLVSIILYFFVFDLIYMSTASVKSSGKQSGLLGAFDAGIDISALDDFGLGGVKSSKELALYEEILRSRRCLEPLIDKFNLMEREGSLYKEDILKNIKDEKLKITIDKLSGIMYISIMDKDKVLAKNMVEFLLEQLNIINIEMNVQNAKNNREFIEKRFLLAKEDLVKSEDSLKAFQLVYGIAPDLQIKASAQSIFSLEAELKAEEVKLDVVKKILNNEQPEVKVQEVKINSIKEKIASIKSSTDLNDILRLGNSPQIALSFLRLQREVEIQTKIMTFLLPLFEQAKIEEKRDTPTILILDKPNIADKKSKPKRLTMVMLITLLGFIFSYSLFILLYKWNYFKKNLNQYLNSK